MKRLTAEELVNIPRSEVNMIDIRPFEEFIISFYPGSIYFPIEKSLPYGFVQLIGKNQKLVLICDKDADDSVGRFLNENGYETPLGYYVFNKKEVEAAGVGADMIVDVDPDEFGMDAKFDNKMVVADVRPYEKYAQGHIKNAISFPLTDFSNLALIADLDEKGSIYFYGDSKTEAAAAASVLKKLEMHNLRIVNKGWDKIKKEPLIKVNLIKGK